MYSPVLFSKKKNFFCLSYFFVYFCSFLIVSYLGLLELIFVNGVREFKVQGSPHIMYIQVTHSLYWEKHLSLLL